MSHTNLCLIFRIRKVGRVFPMVIVSILPQAEFGRNVHREDTPHFIWNTNHSWDLSKARLRFNIIGTGLSYRDNDGSKTDFWWNWIVKWGASFRWSFRPSSAWGSIETTTIGKTQPTLFREPRPYHEIFVQVATLLRFDWISFFYFNSSFDYLLKNLKMKN